MYYSIDLVAPIILFNKSSDGDYKLFENIKESSLVSRRLADNDSYMHKIEIIDSGGNLYRVTECSILKNSNRLFGFDLFLDRTVYVYRQLQLVEKLDLAQSKKLLLGLLSKPKSDLISRNLTFSQLMDSIENARNLDDLFQVFKSYE